MKSALKYIRSIRWINHSSRVLLKQLFTLNKQLDNYFSIHFPVSGIVTTKLPGGEKLKLYSDGKDFIPSQIFWKGFGGYEGNSELLFYWLCKKSDTVIDVGANIGYYSLVAAISNPKLKIIAFEPVEHIINRFRKQIEINSINNIKIEPLIVNNNSEPLTFYIPKGSNMDLAASTKKGWVSNTVKKNISSISLDDYFESRDINTISLVKLDCEFHEFEVLEGMSNLLKKYKPAIIIEILFPESIEVTESSYTSDYHIKIQEIFKNNNYYNYLITQSALIRVDEIENNSDSRNYFFSSKKSIKTYMPFSEIESWISSVI